MHTSGSVKPICHKTYPIKLLQYPRFLVSRTYEVQGHQFLCHMKYIKYRHTFIKSHMEKKIKIGNERSPCWHNSYAIDTVWRQTEPETSHKKSGDKF